MDVGVSASYVMEETIIPGGNHWPWMGEHCPAKLTSGIEPVSQVLPQHYRVFSLCDFIMLLFGISLNRDLFWCIISLMCIHFLRQIILLKNVYGPLNNFICNLHCSWWEDLWGSCRDKIWCQLPLECSVSQNMDRPARTVGVKRVGIHEGNI